VTARIRPGAVPAGTAAGPLQWLGPETPACRWPLAATGAGRGGVGAVRWSRGGAAGCRGSEGRLQRGGAGVLGRRCAGPGGVVPGRPGRSSALLPPWTGGGSSGWAAGPGGCGLVGRTVPRAVARNRGYCGLEFRAEAALLVLGVSPGRRFLPARCRGRAGAAVGPGCWRGRCVSGGAEVVAAPRPELRTQPGGPVTATRSMRQRGGEARTRRVLAWGTAGAGTGGPCRPFGQSRHLGGGLSSRDIPAAHPAARKAGGEHWSGRTRTGSSPGRQPGPAHRSVAGKAVGQRSWRAAAGQDRITAPTGRGAKTSAIETCTWFRGFTLTSGDVPAAGAAW